MSDIAFKCPLCLGQLIVDAAAAGRKVQCSFCAKPIRVPGLQLVREMHNGKVTCPKCKQHLQIPPELLGTDLVCPTCQTRMQLPLADIGPTTTALPPQNFGRVMLVPSTPPLPVPTRLGAHILPAGLQGRRLWPILLAAAVLLSLLGAGGAFCVYHFWFDEDRGRARSAESTVAESFGPDTPELAIIPGKAHDKAFSSSRSRFLISRSNGQLLATGSQNMAVKMKSLGGSMQMEPDYWGLGGEHAFKCNFDGWENSSFSIKVRTDPTFPLTFKVTKKGYAYLCGKGTVIVKGGGEFALGNDISDEAWIARLKNPNQLVREGACEAAARCGLKMAVPSLCALLSDPAWEVRRNACEALGCLGDTAAIVLLEPLKEDKERAVQEAATYAIKQLQGDTPKDASGHYMFRTKE